MAASAAGLLNQKVSCKKCKNEFKIICLISRCVQIRFTRLVKGRLLLGCTGLGTLGSVLGTTLCAVLNACGIECTANDMVAYTGEVLNTAAANEHDRVFLQIVAFAGDVGVHFLAIGETDTGNLTHCRVRFLRGGGVHAHTYAAALGARVESGALALVFQTDASFAY